jgi:hypothetical protein
MDAQPFPLPPEMAQAIAANGGLPLRLEDPDTHELYLLVEQPTEISLDEEYLDQELAKGLADFETGRFAPWDMEKTIAEARRRHDSKNK